MRLIIFAASAAALAAPAYAQSSPSFPREMDREIARSLPSPGEVEGAADVAGRAAEAILDVPVGGLVHAIDPTRPVRRDETIGDMAGRDDPYLRERVRDSVEGVAVGMQDMIARVAVVAPELRRALAGIEESIDRSLRTVDDRRYERDRYRR